MNNAATITAINRALAQYRRCQANAQAITPREKPPKCRCWLSTCTKPICPMLATLMPTRNQNVWSAARLQGLVWARRQVCANVFGLWLETNSPGHDEMRACLPL